jgi:hypothetical protein
MYKGRVVSMDSKEYKISEIVDTIGVSKATVYNKLGSLKDLLRNHIKVRKGIKYIDSKGLEIIKNSIGFSKEQYTDLKDNSEIELENIDNSTVSSSLETLERLETLEKKPLTESCQPEAKDVDNSTVSKPLEINSKYTESLETQIGYLKSIITEKDKQMNSLNDALNTAQRLNENSQVLLRQQQDKIFFLESADNQKASSKPWWRVWK